MVAYVKEHVHRRVLQIAVGDAKEDATMDARTGVMAHVITLVQVGARTVAAIINLCLILKFRNRWERKTEMKNFSQDESSSRRQ